MPTGASKSRRRFIKSAGTAGVIGLAGCAGGGDGGGGDGGDGGGDGGDGGGGDGGDGGGSTSQSSTDLRILSVNSSQGWQDHYNQVVSAWEEETNHTLEVQIVGVDQGIESVSRQLRAGDPPHLVHDQAWGDPGNFIAEGLTVPVEDITSRINGWDEIPDRLKFTYQGEIMNVPTDMILNMASVRRDLLEQAGINLDPYLEEPWNVTFEEWTSWARAVDEHPDIEARGASFALATTGALGFTGLLKWAWGNDVTMWTGTQDNPEIRFDQGDNVDKLTHVLETLEENYQYAPNTVDWEYSDFLTNMGNGNVAIGASLDPSIVAFTTATDTVRENLYGVGNPLGPSYSQWDLRNWTSGNSLVPMETDNSDVALDFIAWYMNSEVGNTRFEARPIHNGPVRLETYDSEIFTSIPYVQDHPEQVNYYKHAIENDTHQPYSYTEDNLEWIPGLSGAYANGELGKIAYWYIEEGMSAEEAISQSAEQVRSYL